MENFVIIKSKPTQVTAHRLPNGKVAILAAGYEDGYQQIHIAQTPEKIYPPMYAVYGALSPVIGPFKYHVSKVVDYPADKGSLVFVTYDGQMDIPITSSEQKDAPKIEGMMEMASLHNNLQDNQVIGYAYNSFTYQTAFADAVRQITQKYEGKTHAKVVESGFVGASSSAGIAYTYVIMENAS